MLLRARLAIPTAYNNCNYTQKWRQRTANDKRDGESGFGHVTPAANPTSAVDAHDTCVFRTVATMWGSGSQISLLKMPATNEHDEKADDDDGTDDEV